MKVYLLVGFLKIKITVLKQLELNTGGLYSVLPDGHAITSTKW